MKLPENIKQKLLELEDEICSEERLTGNEYTLILIPHEPFSIIHGSLNGKPVTNGMDVKNFFNMALQARKEP